MRLWVAGLAVVTAALGGTPAARADNFRPFTTFISVEAGPTYNFLRLDRGTRQTPTAGGTAGVTFDVNVLHSPWHPHRLSVVGGLWPTAQANFQLPTSGVRPGLGNPLPNPHMLSYLAAGLGFTGGVRYRWETGTTFAPFLEAGAFGHAHKVLRPGPPHFNVGLRAGGGMEYFVVDRVAVFGSFDARTGPLLWPVPYQVPVAEGTVELLWGARIRAF
ncbi:MAG: hypothetical protein HY904_17105 [Deltaproteobacteria bacterium]|nr:hypothetical protein [Deltaproteobacteria bacterium]